ncbi:hypothetical protein Hanom_Chr16g01433211 [Helianthus anomalus]
MGGEVLPIIPLPCLLAGGGQVSTHLGEPRGWWQSSSRPWPQRPVSSGWHVVPCRLKKVKALFNASPM